MSDADFNAGTRSQPLGDPKAGRSADLDALAAYVASLTTFDNSPYRTSSGALTSAASAGKTLFTSMNCGSCHSGTAFTGSGANTLVDIGTVKPSSGSRLGAALTGIDVPTLRDVWATAPYLHDGSAATLGDAVRAHNGVTVGDADLANLVAYLQQIGAEESAAPVNAGTGTGLTGRYYNNTNLSGNVRARRARRASTSAGVPASPGTGVNSRQLLGALERDGAGAGYRNVPLPDRLGRRHPPVGERGAAHQQLDRALLDHQHQRHHQSDRRHALFDHRRVLRGRRPGGSPAALADAGQQQLRRHPDQPAVPGAVTVGTGLTGSYYNTNNLSGNVVLTRIEAVNFGWGTASPGTGVNADNFSVRWSGTVLAPTTGTYRFQTVSDDGIRLWVERGAAHQQLDGALLDDQQQRDHQSDRRDSLYGHPRVLRGRGRCGSKAAMADAGEYQLRRHSDQPVVPELIRRSATAEAGPHTRARFAFGPCSLPSRSPRQARCSAGGRRRGAGGGESG